MATNVTEKDKTLQEIIDWCEQLEIDGLRLANALLMQRDTTPTELSNNAVAATNVYILEREANDD